MRLLPAASGQLDPNLTLVIATAVGGNALMAAAKSLPSGPGNLTLSSALAALGRIERAVTEVPPDPAAAPAAPTVGNVTALKPPPGQAGYARADLVVGVCAIGLFGLVACTAAQLATVQKDAAAAAPYIQTACTLASDLPVGADYVDLVCLGVEATDHALQTLPGATVVAMATGDAGLANPAPAPRVTTRVRLLLRRAPASVSVTSPTDAGSGG